MTLNCQGFFFEAVILSNYEKNRYNSDQFAKSWMLTYIPLSPHVQPCFLCAGVGKIQTRIPDSIGTSFADTQGTGGTKKNKKARLKKLVT
jgi:hypothetical protein